MDKHPLLSNPGEAGDCGLISSPFSYGDDCSSSGAHEITEETSTSSPGTQSHSPSSRPHGDFAADSDNNRKPLVRSLSSCLSLITNTGERKLPMRSLSSCLSLITNTRDRESIPGATNKSALAASPIIRKACITLVLCTVFCLILYFAIGSFNYHGHATVEAVDALYFTVVTLATVGYGDIVPCGPITKLSTCLLILVGFVLFGILLNGLVTYICDRQEAVVLGIIDRSCFNTLLQSRIVEEENGTMSIRAKVFLALAVVGICIFVGTVMVHSLEHLGWVDSFYLSIASVTTVGYGDHSFKTVKGRSFAVVWLLVSALVVAKALQYFTDLIIDKWNRLNADRIFQQRMSLRDLIAADLDNDRCISKAEFILHKLRRMGKVTERDIMQIGNQFDILDRTKCGRITRSRLMESNHFLGDGSL